MKLNDYIYSASGIPIDPINPNFENVAPQRLMADIAVQGARTYRFASAVSYTVAQHQRALSVYIEQLYGDVVPTWRQAARWALVHDAMECLTGCDVPSPLKQHLVIVIGEGAGAFGAFERDRWLAAIGRRLGLPWPVPDVVWSLDLALMRFEAKWLFRRGHPIREANRPRCESAEGPADVPPICALAIAPTEEAIAADYLDRWDELSRKREPSR